MFRACLFSFLAILFSASSFAAERPNILWLTSEDHGPHMGCYGFEYANTPHIDALAKKGMKFAKCWSNAPVCAPARTTLITGMHPTSLGAEHMRSEVNLPADFKLFPQYLRDAGYYCTNNSKEDYNVTKPGKVWDESSNKAHYQNRKDGQPFFAVFNATQSHESQLRGKKAKPVHDPAKVPLPSYHPDLPEVRHEWAHYHDNITKVDAIAGEHLKELADAGLDDDTIVFYFADHGSGMPRSKRTPCNSGLHVPLVVYFPPKWEHLAPKGYKAGGTSEQLVSFVDFAPTVLSLGDVDIPFDMQGVPFAGESTEEPRKHLFGFRGRMDERHDLVRSATDGRFVYVRNFMPHLPHGQHVAYMFQTRTTVLWKELAEGGTATKEQSLYWQRRQPEELYDLKNDPDEVVNLAGRERYREKLDELRYALQDQMEEICDVGLLPEDEIHSRSKGSSPFEVGHDLRYGRLLKYAWEASDVTEVSTRKLEEGFEDSDSAVRYWSALGFLMRQADLTKDQRTALVNQLKDVAPCARMAAAAALAEHTTGDDHQAALQVLLKLADPEQNSQYVAAMALNFIDNLGDKAKSIHEPMRKFSREQQSKGRGAEKVPVLLNHILGPAK